MVAERQDQKYKRRAAFTKLRTYIRRDPNYALVLLDEMVNAEAKGQKRMHALEREWTSALTSMEHGIDNIEVKFTGLQTELNDQKRAAQKHRAKVTALKQDLATKMEEVKVERCKRIDEKYK